MTVAESVLAELATGPKTLTHLERRCAPAPKWPDVRPRDITGVLALMVSEGSIDVQEWVVERGRFVPVYRRRKRWPSSRAESTATPSADAGSVRGIVLGPSQGRPWWA